MICNNIQMSSAIGNLRHNNKVLKEKFTILNIENKDLKKENKSLNRYIRSLEKGSSKLRIDNINYIVKYNKLQKEYNRLLKAHRKQDKKLAKHTKAFLTGKKLGKTALPTDVEKEISKFI